MANVIVLNPSRARDGLGKIAFFRPAPGQDLCKQLNEPHTILGFTTHPINGAYHAMRAMRDNLIRDDFLTLDMFFVLIKNILPNLPLAHVLTLILDVLYFGTYDLAKTLLGTNGLLTAAFNELKVLKMDVQPAGGNFPAWPVQTLMLAAALGKNFDGEYTVKDESMYKIQLLGTMGVIYEYSGITDLIPQVVIYRKNVGLIKTVLGHRAGVSVEGFEYLFGLMLIDLASIDYSIFVCNYTTPFGSAYLDQFFDKVEWIASRCRPSVRFRVSGHTSFLPATALDIVLNLNMEYGALTPLVEIVTSLGFVHVNNDVDAFPTAYARAIARKYKNGV